jgi:hypothetical protein
MSGFTEFSNYFSPKLGFIELNASNLNITFDSTANASNAIMVENPGTDSFTYNATSVPGATQPDNVVEIYGNAVPFFINGNGATQVDFTESVGSDVPFNLYKSLTATVYVNDSSIDVQDSSSPSPLSDVVLTPSSITGATIGAIDFTNPTGLTFEGVESTPITMTVVNTPAGVTTSLNLTDANLTILGTSGPLNVTGSEGSYPQSNVTIGNGTLAGIAGSIVLSGEAGGPTYGYIVTILDQDAGPASNVAVTGVGFDEVITGLIAASISFDGRGSLNLYGPAGSTYSVGESIATFNLFAGSGSTVNILDPYVDAINFLTVLGAAQVNIAQGDLKGISNNITIEADPSRPTALTDVTINATQDGGDWNFLLGDGPSGFDAFQFAIGDGTLQAIDLQANTSQLTLEFATSVSTHHGLTVNDTGPLPSTIDEGAEPTTITGTTGPLTLESNDPASITIGNAGSLQAINGEVDVLTTNPTANPTALVVDDSSDPTSRSSTLAPVAAGLFAINGLSPAPIHFTAAQYELTLNGGTGGNGFTIDDTATGSPSTEARAPIPWPSPGAATIPSSPTIRPPASPAPARSWPAILPQVPPARSPTRASPRRPPSPSPHSPRPPPASPPPSASRSTPQGSTSTPPPPTTWALPTSPSSAPITDRSPDRSSSLPTTGPSPSSRLAASSRLTPTPSPSSPPSTASATRMGTSSAAARTTPRPSPSLRRPPGSSVCPTSPEDPASPSMSRPPPTDCR